MSDCIKSELLSYGYFSLSNETFRVLVVPKYVYGCIFTEIPSTFYSPVKGSPSAMLDLLIVEMDKIITDARDMKLKLESEYAMALVAEKEKKC